MSILAFLSTFTLCIALCLCAAASFSQAIAKSLGSSMTAMPQQSSLPATVTITKFVPTVSVKGAHFYRLSFSYDFPNRTKVIVRGFGEVPAKGNLSFLTSEKTLTFIDERGTVLKQVALKVTGSPEGAGSKMPAPDDFPPEYQGYTRVGQLTPEQCDAALNEFFENGYHPRVEQGITYYVTTFQPLKDAPSTKIAQMALQISTPYTAAGDANKTSFHVQMIVQERGRRSAESAREVSQETIKAANELRKKVVDRLLQGDQSQ